MKNFILFFCFFIVFFSSCVLIKETKKTKIKNNAVNRFTHDLVSRNNIYYNGYSAFNQGIYLNKLTPEKSYKEILPVFKYNNVNEDSKIYYEYAIKKCYKIIARHSILDQGIEYNKWVDNSYLLLAKSAYLLGKYDETIEILRFFLSTFKYSNLYFEAYLWKIKVFIRKKYFAEVDEMFKIYEYNSKKPHLEKEKNLIYVDYLIATEKYNESIKYLEEAIKKEKNEYFKKRLTFLLAQVYNILNNKNKSYYYSSIVSKNWSIPFDLIVQAKLLEIENAPLNNSKEQNNVLKKIKKLNKNENFDTEFGKIFYSLGVVYSRIKKYDSAISNFEKSLTYNEDSYHKAKTNLALAEIYFNKKDYKNANKFYTEVVSLADNNFPKIEKIRKLAKNLEKIIYLEKSIEDNKRLIELSLLNNDQQEEELKKISYLRKEEEKKKISLEKKEREILEQRAKEYEKAIELENIENSKNSNFYFTNPKLRADGIKLFKAYWGERKNEDQWRRIYALKSTELENKFDTIVSLNVNDSIKNERIKEKLKNDSIEKSRLENASKTDDISSKIPKNDVEKEIIKSKIEKAIYDLALLFKNEINEIKIAEELLLELIKNYPKTSYKERAYFIMYVLAFQQNNVKKYQYYETLIKENFPNSYYLLRIKKILANELFDEENEIRNMYEKLYSNFKSANYFDVLKDGQYLISISSNSKINAKINFLMAESFGYMKDFNKMRTELESILKNYNEPIEIIERSKILLDLIPKE